MNDIIIGVASAVGSAVLIYTGGLIKTAVRRRVTIRSPESVAIAKMVPAVNALVEVQGPQLEALVALLEATKGICNGNVDRALETTQDARQRFHSFLEQSAKVG